MEFKFALHELRFALHELNCVTNVVVRDTFPGFAHVYVGGATACHFISDIADVFYKFFPPDMVSYDYDGVLLCFEIDLNKEVNKAAVCEPELENNAVDTGDSIINSITTFVDGVTGVTVTMVDTGTVRISVQGDFDYQMVADAIYAVLPACVHTVGDIRREVQLGGYPLSSRIISFDHFQAETDTDYTAPSVVQCRCDLVPRQSADYPDTCLKCGAPAYVGLNNVDCSAGCE